MKTILATLITIGTLANADFTRDDATGIVTDNKTNLQWQDDAVGGVKSHGAVQSVDAKLSLWGVTPTGESLISMNSNRLSSIRKREHILMELL